ncbi:30S ribosomal protein S8, chloroplastic [Dirofilaria immitis]
MQTLSQDNSQQLLISMPTEGDQKAATVTSSRQTERKLITIVVKFRKHQPLLQNDEEVIPLLFVLHFSSKECSGMDPYDFCQSIQSTVSILAHYGLTALI